MLIAICFGCLCVAVRPFTVYWLQRLSRLCLGSIWNSTCFLLFHTTWFTQLLKYSQGMHLFVNCCVQDCKNCEKAAGCFGDNPESRHSTANASQPTQTLSSSLLSLLHCREHDNCFGRWWQWHTKSSPSHENGASSGNGPFSWMMEKILFFFNSLFPSGLNTEQLKHKFLTIFFFFFFLKSLSPFLKSFPFSFHGVCIHTAYVWGTFAVSCCREFWGPELQNKFRANQIQKNMWA